MRPVASAALLCAVLVGGCATIGTPNAPIAVTSAGHRCVQQCQALHDHCLARASASAEEYWSFANPLVDACNDQLGRCYATCPG
jgi:hypothetical protein